MSKSLFNSPMAGSHTTLLNSIESTIFERIRTEYCGFLDTEGCANSTPGEPVYLTGADGEGCARYVCQRASIDTLTRALRLDGLGTA